MAGAPPATRPQEMPASLSSLILVPQRIERVVIPEVETHGRKFVIIINGDPAEPRHRDNPRYAIDALRARGFQEQNMFVGGEFSNSERSRVHKFAATRQGLDNMLHEVSKRTGQPQPGDKIVIYVTGHGELDRTAQTANIILEGRERINHQDFITLLSPIKAFDSVFVFDQCYSGALLHLLMQTGFKGIAMAPSVEGKETMCQFFSPLFWKAVQTGMDLDGDRKTMLAEIFRYSIDFLNTKRRDASESESFGVFRRSIAELDSIEKLRNGAAVLEIRTSWCQACAAQEVDMNSYAMLVGGSVATYQIDWEKNTVKRQLEGQIGKITSFPALVFIQDGHIKKVVRGRLSTDQLLSESRTAFKIEPLTTRSIIRTLVAQLESACWDLQVAGGIGLLQLNLDRQTSRKLRETLEGMNPSALAKILEGAGRINHNLLAQNPELLQLIANQLDISLAHASPELRRHAAAILYNAARNGVDMISIADNLLHATLDADKETASHAADALALLHLSKGDWKRVSQLLANPIPAVREATLEVIRDRAEQGKDIGSAIETIGRLISAQESSERAVNLCIEILGNAAEKGVDISAAVPALKYSLLIAGREPLVATIALTVHYINQKQWSNVANMLVHKHPKVRKGTASALAHEENYWSSERPTKKNDIALIFQNLGLLLDQRPTFDGHLSSGIIHKDIGDIFEKAARDGQNIQPALAAINRVLIDYNYKDDAYIVIDFASALVWYYLHRKEYAKVAELLTNKNRYIRGSAAAVLSQAGERNLDLSGMLPVAIDMVSSDNRDVRLTGLILLSELAKNGQDIVRTIPALLQMLSGSENTLAAFALAAHYAHGGQWFEVARLLAMHSNNVMLAVVDTLNRPPFIDANRTPLLQFLGDIANSDPDQRIRKRAADAIKRLTDR